MSTQSSPPIGCEPHNHQHCIDGALLTAQQQCAANGVRLTPLRERVLELVWQNHKPLGAYDILARLSQEDGRKSAPPTVYRALEFLLEQGLVHRIASLNAYIGCPFPGQPHHGYFLICELCLVAIELEGELLQSHINTLATDNGFKLRHTILEVSGLCPTCQLDEDSTCPRP